MPTIGGVNIAWDESKPAGGDSIGIGDDQIRSDKTALRNALAAEHNFASGGGAATGYHVFGSARPFYGPQSAVSSSGSDGRLMMTSDTSRLFGVGSNGTVFLGGATVISAGSFPGTNPQRFYWAMEFGSGNITVIPGSTTVTIPNSGYNGIPFVVACVSTENVSVVVGKTLIVSNKQTSSFVVSCGDQDGAISSASFDWWSMGTRTF